MDMAAEMLQLPQFRPVERRTEAELTYRTVNAGLLFVWRGRNQGNLHAQLQDLTATVSCAEPADGLHLNRSPERRLMQIKKRPTSSPYLAFIAAIERKTGR
jgi:hypothetical protein